MDAEVVEEEVAAEAQSDVEAEAPVHVEAAPQTVAATHREVAEVNRRGMTAGQASMIMFQPFPSKSVHIFVLQILACNTNVFYG